MKLFSIFLLLLPLYYCDGEKFTYVLSKFFRNTKDLSLRLNETHDFLLRHHIDTCTPLFNNYTTSVIHTCDPNGEYVIVYHYHDVLCTTKSLYSSKTYAVGKYYDKGYFPDEYVMYSCIYGNQLIFEDSEYAISNIFFNPNNCDTDPGIVYAENTRRCVKLGGKFFRYDCYSTVSTSAKPSLVEYDDSSCNNGILAVTYLTSKCSKLPKAPYNSKHLVSYDCYNSKFHNENELLMAYINSYRGQFIVANYSTAVCNAGSELRYQFFTLNSCVTSYSYGVPVSSLKFTCNGDHAMLYKYNAPYCMNSSQTHNSETTLLTMNYCYQFSSVQCTQTLDTIYPVFTNKRDIVYKHNATDDLPVIVIIKFFDSSCVGSWNYELKLLRILDVCYSPDEISPAPYKLEYSSYKSVMIRVFANNNCATPLSVLTVDSCYDLKSYGTITPGRFATFTFEQLVMDTQTVASLYPFSIHFSFYTMLILLLFMIIVITPVIVIIYRNKQQHQYLHQDSERFSSALDFEMVSLSESSHLNDSVERSNFDHVIDDSISRNEEASILSRVIANLPYNSNSGEPMVSSNQKYSWINIVKIDSFSTTIREVLELYPKLRYRLAYYQENNVSVIDIASSLNKTILLEYTTFMNKYKLDEFFYEKINSLNPNEIFVYETECNTEIGNQQVILKFMKDKDCYINEINIRNHLLVDSSYCLEIIDYFDGDCDESLLSELKRHSLTYFRYIVVTPMVESYLFALIYPKLQELSRANIIDNYLTSNGNRLENSLFGILDIRTIISQLVDCLCHLETLGYAHGDLSFMNIVLHKTQWKLSDFDNIRQINQLVNMSSLEDSCIPISSYNRIDSAGLGMILYWLCLCLPTSNTNGLFVEIDELYLLKNSKFILKNINFISNAYARSLISLLLERDDSKVFAVRDVINHPFMTGRIGSRLIGELPKYNIFLSYHSKYEYMRAEKLYYKLTSLGLNVWFDAFSVKPGKSRDEFIFDGLHNSAIFMIILSKDTVNNVSSNDSILLEQLLALELKAKGLIHHIYPVMFCDIHYDAEHNRNYNSNFFRDINLNNFQSPSLNLVNDKMRKFLRLLYIGHPTLELNTIQDVFRETIRYQGILIEMSLDNIMERICNDVYLMSNA